MDKVLAFIKRWWLVIISGLIILAVVLVAAIYILTSIDEPELIEATGRMQTGFSVYYIENDLFPSNPVPANLHFIRQLIDRIELFSGFNVSFSQSLSVLYSYTARTHFVVQYTGSGMPVIFEEISILSQIEGSRNTDSLVFMSFTPYPPGGVYVIDLNEFEEKFNNFVEQAVELQEAVVDEDGIALRSFVADFSIEFTYNVRAPAVGINETITNRFNIPIGTNVFTLEAGGPAGFTASVVVVADSSQLEFLVLLMFVGVFLLGAIGMSIGLRNLNHEANEKRKLANNIIKKYNTEMVVSKDNLDLTGLRIVMVDEFEEILKLSINLSKHINCYKDHVKAEFVTIVDDFAYCYRIVYGRNFDTYEVDELAEIEEY